MKNAASKTTSTKRTPKIVDAAELAAILKIDRATIYKHRHAGKLPEPKTRDGKMTWNFSAVRKLAA